MRICYAYSGLAVLVSLASAVGAQAAAAPCSTRMMLCTAAVIGNNISVGITDALSGAVSLDRVSSDLARPDFYNMPLAAARAARFDALTVMPGMNDVHPIAGARLGTQARREE